MEWLLVPVIVLALVFTLVLCNGFIRRTLITKPLLGLYKRVLPPISETEQAAIDGGDVWWEGSLFSGRPNWEQLHQWSKPRLSPEEQHFMEHQVDHLCSLLDDWQITHEDHDLAPDVWKYLKEEGFFGMIIPKHYGGLGFSAYMHSEVITAIATHSISAAVSTMVPNSLGPAELLLHYGTEEQKQYYLPRLAIGKEIPCFALTGPEAGSDATSMPDTGIIIKQLVNGQEQLMIVLSWEKRYITLAPVATVLGLAFKLYDPNHFLGSKTELGITLGLIPTDHPGVEIGTRHWPLNAVFMNGPTRGKNVVIPMEWIIGGAPQIGRGWHMLMECLSAGRGISLPALSAATGAVCFRGSSAYAYVRRQFKTPIGQFEGVAQSLARIGGIQYALNAMRNFTSMAVDQGIKPAVASAIAKYHMTELARIAINDAMDIHGGRGIILGPRNYLGAVYQSMPISITVEGANILTRNLIIFGQGAIRCHPYLLAEIKAIDDLVAFDRALMAHIGYVISNSARGLFFGLSRGYFIKAPSVSLKRYYQKVTWMSTVLAILADLAMLVLGGSLKRREALSARLGDILSYLYVITAMFHYFYHEGQPKEDKPYIEWMCQLLFHQIEIAIVGFLQNFPIKGLGSLIKFCLFPWGFGFAAPKDTHTHDLALQIQTLSQVRDRLSKHQRLSKPLAVVENAFQKMLETAALSKKLDRHMDFEQGLTKALAEGILNQQEAEQLRAAEVLRLRAIGVDEFSK